MMMPMNMQQPLQQQQRPEPIDLPFTQKIFKRASYHIAIAYHIHIKQCRERGIIGAEMDPAYHARRLKESKRNEG